MTDHQEDRLLRHHGIAPEICAQRAAGDKEEDSEGDSSEGEDNNNNEDDQGKGKGKEVSGAEEPRREGLSESKSAAAASQTEVTAAVEGGLSEYDQARARNIQNNKQILENLGLGGGSKITLGANQVKAEKKSRKKKEPTPNEKKRTSPRQQ